MIVYIVPNYCAVIGINKPPEVLQIAGYLLLLYLAY